MKKCFSFEKSHDCKRVSDYLIKTLSITIDTRLRDFIPCIMVDDENYKEVVVLGANYMVENNIPGTWVNAFVNETDPNLVPFAYMAMDYEKTTYPHCLSSDSLSILFRFTDFCESYLKRKVFTQVLSDGFLVFLIQRPISVEEQLSLVSNLKEHSAYLECITNTKVMFTDYFGFDIPKNL